MTKKLFILILILLIITSIIYYKIPDQKEPVLTNINIDSIEIADQVNLVNLFNPDILGKKNIGYSIAYLTMKPGAEIPLRSLEHDEVQYYIQGKATIIINNNVYNVKAGDSLFIPKNSIQKTIAITELKFLSIVEPAWNPDIEKRIE